MGVPEERTAGKHRVKNLGQQLHTIKKPLKPSKGFNFSCKPTYMLNWTICFPQTSEKVPVIHYKQFNPY